jgi:hypothetical protein
MADRIEVYNPAGDGGMTMSDSAPTGVTSFRGGGRRTKDMPSSRRRGGSDLS